MDRPRPSTLAPLPHASAARPRAETCTILVLSDIHYASAAEQARGCSEFKVIKNPLLRALVRGYRHFIWRRNPFAHNPLLTRFTEQTDGADLVVANGDYSCDTAFVGVCDDAAFESARVCLEELRARCGPRLRLTLGDHELGKMSLFGGRGGPRLASWHRALEALHLDPFWTLTQGRYVLVGVTSSLIALPVYESEALPEERPQWHELRRAHLESIRRAFATLKSEERVLLFCHDPTALPFLWEEPVIQSRLSQIDATIIGHLHSRLFLWNSRLLSGMPAIRFLGNSIRRMSTALNRARLWGSFRVHLCPALAGIELLNDGGYLRVTLDPAARRPLEVRQCRL